MDEYFKFKFWKETIIIGLVVLVVMSVFITTLFYKLKEYLKKRFGKRVKK